MNKIEIKILNPEAIKEARTMTAFCARLTQRGHIIKNINDLTQLYEKNTDDHLIENLTKLPHPTIQKFTVINIAIIGASRRFLAQITRHQNEVKFMSASLQYSDYSDNGDFCIPYEILERGQDSVDAYIMQCQQAMREYKYFAKFAGNDAAGYLAPQGLRNILIISATPFQWKHMIGQRTCRRNTSETRFVMLKIWESLYDLDPILFSSETTGPFCQRSKCLEGNMTCGNSFNKNDIPAKILKNDYSLIVNNKEE